MAIPRAIIYHSLPFEIQSLLSSFLDSRDPESDPAIIHRFERRFADYMGTRHAIAFPFARTALYFCLKSQDFPRGSEIVMPPITIKPMVDVVVNLGLKPVFVDLEPETLCFDLERLERAVNQNTRAILVTYLFGVVPDIERLLVITSRHRLFVVEDFSHSLNSEFRNKKLGTFGDVGIYSCSVSKTLDAYGGGLAVTDDKQLAKKLEFSAATLAETPRSRLRSKIRSSLIWNLATRRLIFTFATWPLLRLFRALDPTLYKKILGSRQDLKAHAELPAYYFERFTSFQAKVADAMLTSVSTNDAVRMTNADQLRRSLVPFGEPFARSQPETKNVSWQFVVFPIDKQKFEDVFAANGIDTGTTNLSLVNALGIYPEYEDRCPAAEHIKLNAMYVPAYPRLSNRDVAKISRALQLAFDESDAS